MSIEVAEFRKTLQLFAWRMNLVLLYFDSVFFTCDVSCRVHRVFFLSLR